MFTRRIGLCCAGAMLILLTACLGDVDGPPKPRTSPDSDSRVEIGRAVIARHGCGSCHSIPGVPGADAMAAPPLHDFYMRSVIAGKLPNTAENLAQWIQNPQAIVPGNAMPNLGVTQEEADAIVAYLYHQPALSDWLRR